MNWEMFLLTYVPWKVLKKTGSQNIENKSKNKQMGPNET